MLRAAKKRCDGNRRGEVVALAQHAGAFQLRA
jgi:hypothetical protein